MTDLEDRLRRLGDIVGGILVEAANICARLHAERERIRLALAEIDYDSDHA